MAARGRRIAPKKGTGVGIRGGAEREGPGHARHYVAFRAIPAISEGDLGVAARAGIRHKSRDFRIICRPRFSEFSCRGVQRAAKTGGSSHDDAERELRLFDQAALDRG